MKRLQRAEGEIDYAIILNQFLPANAYIHVNIYLLIQQLSIP